MMVFKCDCCNNVVDYVIRVDVNPEFNIVAKSSGSGWSSGIVSRDYCQDCLNRLSAYVRRMIEGSGKEEKE